jgi:hypothetical protein
MGRGAMPPESICRAVGPWFVYLGFLGLQPGLVYVGPLALGSCVWGS